MYSTLVCVYTDSHTLLCMYSGVLCQEVDVRDRSAALSQHSSQRSHRAGAIEALKALVSETGQRPSHSALPRGVTEQVL